MKILYLTAHMGGGVGKATKGLALECARKNDIEQKILLLELPEKTMHLNECIKNNIEILYASDENVNIQETLSWADVVIINWWNHPLMSQFVVKQCITEFRCILWLHINGCSYPYLPYELAAIPEKLLITSTYSLENPLWTKQQRKEITLKTHLISGIGDFNPCEIVPKDNYEFNDKFTVGYAGTLSYAKMSPDYFEYCKAFVSENPDVHFLMLGDVDSEIKDDIKKYGLEKYITFTGFVTDIYKYYRQMDVMAYLLNKENYATTENVILEAMAAGVTVVALNNGPERNIIKNTITGVLVENKNEFIAEILKLRNDTAYRKSIGVSARKDVIENYSSEKNAKTFLKILNETLKYDKKKNDFSKVLGNTPYEWFCSCTGRDKTDFENTDNMTDEELTVFLNNLPPIYKAHSKSSIIHFNKYYPEEKKLKRFMDKLNKTAVTPGGVRTPLGEVLPLDMPYLIQIFPVYACNFRCGYCIHSLDKKQHGYISDEVFMSMERYCKIIDDIKNTGKKIKMLRFAAIGEPLLHPQIADMIKYAKEANIADSIDIVTNGALLTKELSDKLIAAGLSKLRISLEGLSSEDYLKNSDARIDFEKFVDNIRYFYEHCDETKMYIKIIDYMVQKKEEQELFYNTFSSITHDIAIEHLTPTIHEIDYDKLSGGMKTDKPQNGENLIISKICPQPFYMMQFNPDGNVVPCCSMKYPCVLGNIDKNTVEEIWTGKEYNEFRQRLLKGTDNAGQVCSECNLYLYDLHSEDVLDSYADVLYDKYK